MVKSQVKKDLPLVSPKRNCSFLVKAFQYGKLPDIYRQICLIPSTTTTGLSDSERTVVNLHSAYAL